MSINYHPVIFYLIVVSIAVIVGPLSQYFKKIQFPLLLLSLFAPCITAITMIFASHNEVLIQDFWTRLVLFKISPPYLLMILLLMPGAVLLATAISLYFGYSSNQFSISNEISIMKGWSIFGMIIPLLMAPIVEELGWRGYGVDSLRAYFNLFTTSFLFGILWGIWHLPGFYIKGFYQNQLLDLGAIYVINFFVSVFVVGILMNWVYYKTDRSIPALILFHSTLNLSVMLFKTEPFTKCIVTVLLCFVTLGLIIYDSHFFFTPGIF